MAIIPYNTIKDIHLEISTLCNASCPLCLRNFFGYKHNNGYEERNMTLAEAKTIFQPEFLKQLHRILFNGNFGDPIMNPDCVAIAQYFREHNENLELTISTNGGARNAEFWQELKALNVNVMFCIDGLEDTNHLYRQGVDWHILMKSVKAYIAAPGKGRSIWKCIEFAHNKHQEAQAKQLSKELGFNEFFFENLGRNNGPVFNQNRQLTHVIGDDPYTETDFNVLWTSYTTREIPLKDATIDNPPMKNVVCDSAVRRSIYVAANGEVSPCCWMGYSPNTFGRGNWTWPRNLQIQKIMTKNNAINYPLEECIQWFDDIEKAWAIKEYKDGRMITCDQKCGR